MVKPLTGSSDVDYYSAYVTDPQRDDQLPYIAECEDIIEALELNFDEANIFKEIWRSANARKGNGKPGHTAFYGAEKIYHYASRVLRRARRNNVSEQSKVIAPNYASDEVKRWSDEDSEFISAGGIARSVGVTPTPGWTWGDKI